LSGWHEEHDAQWKASEVQHAERCDLQDFNLLILMPALWAFSVLFGSSATWHKMTAAAAWNEMSPRHLQCMEEDSPFCVSSRSSAS
jgi:hypothetical protein